MTDNLRDAIVDLLESRENELAEADANAILALPEMAALLADAERVKRVRDLAEEWDLYVAARSERGAPATGTYDDGVNRAQANAAARVRQALDGEQS